MTRTLLTQTLAGVLILALAMGVGACGQTTSATKPPTKAELVSGLAGSPPPLASLHSMMGQVVPKSGPTFAQKLASLRGYPVAVNVWASWCGPCRYEFPMLGQASLKLGRSVGFMGIATRDDPAAAQRFLNGHPVGYPSWSDSGGSLAQSVGVAAGLPTTVIYDRSGKRSYIHQGPYESSAALETDIARYGGK